MYEGLETEVYPLKVLGSLMMDDEYGFFYKFIKIKHLVFLGTEFKNAF